MFGPSRHMQRDPQRLVKTVNAPEFEVTIPIKKVALVRSEPLYAARPAEAGENIHAPEFEVTIPPWRSPLFGPNRSTQRDPQRLAKSSTAHWNPKTKTDIEDDLEVQPWQIAH